MVLYLIFKAARSMNVALIAGQKTMCYCVKEWWLHLRIKLHTLIHMFHSNSTFSLTAPH